MARAEERLGLRSIPDGWGSVDVDSIVGVMLVQHQRRLPGREFNSSWSLVGYQKPAWSTHSLRKEPMQYPVPFQCT